MSLLFDLSSVAAQHYISFMIYYYLNEPAKVADLL